MKPHFVLLKRDLRLSLGRGAEALTTLFFFALIASLFAFALEGEALKKASAGIIWVAGALSSLLSLEKIYHRDAEDGTFDLLLHAPVSPLGIMFSKIAAHWLVSGLALTIASVVVSQMLLMPPVVLKTLIPSLLLGTLYMSLLGGLGATLTFGARRPGLLLALLILPLYVPMLIFGVMAADAAFAELTPRSYILFQGAMVFAALPLTALAGAAFLDAHMRR